MRLKNKRGIKKLFLLGGLFLIVLIPILSFEKIGQIIAGGDYASFINIGIDFPHLFSAWSEKYNFGSPNLYTMWLFPIVFYFHLLQRLNIPYYLIEISWFIGLYALGVIGYYYLIKELYGKSKYYPLIALVGAFLYFFNIFNISRGLPNLEFSLVQAAFPLSLFLWIRGLKSREPLKYAIFFSLASLLYASAFANIAVTAPIFLSIFVISIYYLVITKKIKKILVFISLTLIVFILFNAWWMFDYVNNLIALIKKVQATGSSFAPYGSGGIAEVFRFLRSWGFIAGYYESAALYYKFPILFFSYLIPTLAIASFIIIPRFRKINFYWLVLLILGIFLAKGGDKPFGSLYVWIVENIPGLIAFREPYAKFTLMNVLSISVLFGCSIAGLTAKINNKIKNQRRKILYIITIILGGLLIIINATPQILIGKNTRTYFHIIIPPHVLDTQKWFRNKKQKRIFITPIIKYSHSYMWPQGNFGASSWPAPAYFLNNPLVFYRSLGKRARSIQINQFYDLLDKNNVSLGKTLGYFNTKYILQMNDLNLREKVYGTKNPHEMRDILAVQDSIHLESSLGQWDVYAIDDTKVIPKIFISREIFREDSFSPALIQASNFPKNNLPVFWKGDFNTINNNLETYICRAEKKFFYRSNSCKVNLPQEGEYTILLLPDQDETIQSSFLLNDQESEVEIRKKILYEPSKISQDQQYIYLGQNSLPQGKYNFSFVLEDIKEKDEPAPKEVKNNLELIFVKTSTLKANVHFNSIVDFEKAGRSKYLVDIRKASQPFILVLQESYHPSWQAKIIKKSQKDIVLDHLKVNGFENGWLVDQKGNYQIEIYYQGERILFIGQIVSLGALIFATIYLLKRYALSS